MWTDRAIGAVIALAGVGFGLALRSNELPVLPAVVVAAAAPAAPAPQPMRIEVVQRAAAPQPAAPAAMPEPPLAPAEAAEREQAAWTARMEAVDTEPRNAPWAYEQERTIKQGISTLGLTAKVLDVACKSRRCKITLEWRDREAAIAELHPLVETPSPELQHCGKALSLPEADPNSTTFQAAAVFDCGST